MRCETMAVFISALLYRPAKTAHINLLLNIIKVWFKSLGKLYLPNVKSMLIWMLIEFFWSLINLPLKVIKNLGVEGEIYVILRTNINILNMYTTEYFYRKSQYIQEQCSIKELKTWVFFQVFKIFFSMILCCSLFDVSGWISSVSLLLF